MAPHSTPLWALGSGLLAGFCLCLYSGFFLNKKSLLFVFWVKTVQVVTVPSLKGQPYETAFEPVVCVPVALVQASTVQVKHWAQLHKPEADKQISQFSIPILKQQNHLWTKSTGSFLAPLTEYAFYKLQCKTNLEDLVVCGWVQLQHLQYGFLEGDEMVRLNTSR